jgi:predicted CxxxxCH...CXXCH cytochrome family protein
MKRYFILLTAAWIGFALSSCSKLQNNALAPVQSTGDIHPLGWADSTSSSFHADYIKSHGYDLSACTSCHGTDFKGGIVQKSCYDCHHGAEGPLTCNTCHGSAANPAPPSDLNGDKQTSYAGVGAHQSHLIGGSDFLQVDCATCHTVPQSAMPGVHPSGTGVALVNMEGIALTNTNVPGSRFYDSSIPTVQPHPSFDPLTLKCSNTYCHGDFKGGNNFSPTWNKVGQDQAACGTCHGIPPNTPPHQGQTLQTCFFCHSPMIGPDGSILDSTMHVTGKLTLYGKQLTTW